MRNKIIFVGVLLLVIISFGSCRMHYERAPKRYFQNTRTTKHWGRERHVNTRRMFWGKHRSGMRPHHQRGMFRY